MNEIRKERVVLIAIFCLQFALFFVLIVIVEGAWKPFLWIELFMFAIQFPAFLFTLSKR